MRLLKTLRGAIALTVLTLIVLSINVVQMMSLVILLAMGRRPFTQFNMWCQAFFGHCCAVAIHLCGHHVIVTGDVPLQEDAIVMANHQSMIDIPVLWTWASPLGTCGQMKWFVKDELKFVPGPGWGLWFINALFVKRNWAKDADAIRTTFDKILRSNLPFWVMIFPEGTRMKPSKFAASRAYAERKGMHVYDRVLLPRPKGIWATIQGLRSKLVAIYDVSIAYDEPVAPTARRFMCRGNSVVKIHVTRIPIDSLPTSERDFNQWVAQRFMIKDEWLKGVRGIAR